MASTPEEIAYDQALRSITEQRSRLNDLRTRAATLLSAAAIVTSFLGAEALKDETLGPQNTLVADRSLQTCELIAIVAFLALVGCCLYIVLPRFKRFGGFSFRLNAYKLVRDYVDAEQKMTTAQMHRELAVHMETNYQANEGLLEKRFATFAAGAIFLAVEVLAWIVDLT